MKAGIFGAYSGQAAFLGILSLFAAASLALGAIGWAAYGEVSEQTARYRAYRDLQRDAGQADSLSSAYAGILKDLRLLREALPAENQGSFVLNFLVEDARELDLGIAGISALDEVPFPGYGELPFELDLTGGFRDLVRYLHSLETRGMVLQVRRLAIRSEAINKAKMDAKLEISVFVPAEARARPAGPGRGAP